jgi:predicted component of type VI protein secretion system
VFTLTFIDSGMPRAHTLREGQTVIGRAPACDLTITAPLMSRAHARVRVTNGHVYLSDAGSTYGTIYNGVPLTREQEIQSGDTFSVAQVTLTLEREIAEDELLSEAHHTFDESSSIIRLIDPSARLRRHGRPRRAPSPLRAGRLMAPHRPQRPPRRVSLRPPRQRPQRPQRRRLTRRRQFRQRRLRPPHRRRLRRPHQRQRRPPPLQRHRIP